MNREIDLNAMQKQLGELINSHKVNDLDCQAVIASTLIDIALSLRVIRNKDAGRWKGGPQ